MGIVSLATIIEAAANAALDKSEDLTRARRGRCSGSWIAVYLREMELFNLYCLLSDR